MHSISLGNVKRELTEIKESVCGCKLMREHVGKTSTNKQVNSSEKPSDPVRSPVCDYIHAYKNGGSAHNGCLLEGTMANQVSPGAATD